MKKLSEVCKIVGVTRRTLQEYDKIGLLHPTEIRGEGNYWYYDDTALMKLRAIRIFIEAGYDRRKIKELLESPETDLSEEFEKIIDILEEKKKHIDGVIRTIKVMWLDSTRNAIPIRSFNETDFEKLQQGTDFASIIEGAIQNLADWESFDADESVVTIPMIKDLVYIGLLQDRSPDSADVQASVSNLFDYLVELLNSEEWHPEGEETYQSVFIDWVTNMISDGDMIAMLNDYSGPNTPNFIMDAVHIFCKKQKSGC